jgi:hypothetical protein
MEEVATFSWPVSVESEYEFAVSKYPPLLVLSSLLLFMVSAKSLLLSFSAVPGTGVGINIAGMAVPTLPAVGTGTKGATTGFRALAVPLVLKVSTYLQQNNDSNIKSKQRSSFGFKVQGCKNEPRSITFMMNTKLHKNLMRP